MSRTSTIVVAISVAVLAPTWQTPAQSHPLHAGVAPSPMPTLTATVVDLGHLGGRTSGASAIDGDIVVGTSTTADAASDGHAFVYDLGAANPSMIDLGTLGGTYSTATAVEGGIVIGESETARRDGRAYFYDLSAPTPTMTNLGTLGGGYTSAAGVDGGVVVGYSYTANNRRRAFAYDVTAASPTMIDLGTLGGRESDAAAVEGGIVVGTAQTAAGRWHAFAYDLGAANPTMIDLGTLGGNRSLVKSIDGGVVVGQSTTAARDEHAFAYDLNAASPTMIDLTPGAEIHSQATAIDGGIVAGSFITAGRSEHAFAYDLGAAAPEMADLDTLGGGYSQPTAINGTTVVGYSTTRANSLRGFAYDLAAANPEMTDLGVLGPPLAPAVAVAADGNRVIGSSSVTRRGRHAVVWTLEYTTAPVLTFARLSYPVNENDGAATITVTRSGDLDTAVAVQYRVTRALAGGKSAAVAVNNFTPISGTLAFAAGQTQASLSVPIRNDSTAEGAQRLALLLSNPTGVAVLGTPQVAALRVRQNDQQPDGWIKTRAESGFKGNDIYNLSARGQTRRLPIRRGHANTFYVLVRIDPIQPKDSGRYLRGRVSIHGSTARPGSTVRYLTAGGEDLTPAMQSAEGWNVTLRRGYRLIIVLIRVHPDAPIDADLPATITATFDGDHTRIDRVRAVAWVNP